jgi:hypothetical protein
MASPKNYDKEKKEVASNKENKMADDVNNRLDNLFDENEEEEQDENSIDPNTVSEVENQLDSLFSEDQEAAPEVTGETEDVSAKPEKKASPPQAAASSSKKPEKKAEEVDVENTPLNELKSLVLSLEWEITEQLMEKLSSEIDSLEKQYKNDKIVVAFLQLLASLGKYIRKKRADAHPESIILLHSVYESLEKVMLSPGLTEVIQKKMLVNEVTKYKKLKEQILSKTPAPKKEEKQQAAAKKKMSLRLPREGEEQPVQKEVEEYVDDSSAMMPPFSLADQEAEEEEEEVTEETESVSREYYSEEEAPEESYVSQQAVLLALEEINNTIKSEFQALRKELKSLLEAGQKK